MKMLSAFLLLQGHTSGDETLDQAVAAGAEAAEHGAEHAEHTSLHLLNVVTLISNYFKNVAHNVEVGEFLEVNIDVIIQNKAHDGATNIDFTVPVGDLNDAKTVVDSFVKSAEIKADSYNEDICKVSVVGVGMKSHTGVAAKAFSTMADNNININMISTSEIKVSMVIDEKYAELAVRGLHDAYELDK